MENEYQLRLKDMSHNEKLREVSEEFINERDNLMSKYEVNKLVIVLLSLSLYCVESDDGERERSC